MKHGDVYVAPDCSEDTLAGGTVDDANVAFCICIYIQPNRGANAPVRLCIDDRVYRPRHSQSASRGEGDSGCREICRFALQTQCDRCFQLPELCTLMKGRCCFTESRSPGANDPKIYVELNGDFTTVDCEINLGDPCAIDQLETRIFSRTGSCRSADGYAREPDFVAHWYCGVCPEIVRQRGRTADLEVIARSPDFMEPCELHVWGT